MTAWFLGMMTTALAVFGFGSSADREPAVKAFVMDESLNRPAIQINVNDRQYLFSIQLRQTPGMYGQRITVRVSEQGFTTLDVLQASDVYAPQIDE